MESVSEKYLYDTITQQQDPEKTFHCIIKERTGKQVYIMEITYGNPEHTLQFRYTTSNRDLLEQESQIDKDLREGNYPLFTANFVLRKNGVFHYISFKYKRAIPKDKEKIPYKRNIKSVGTDKCLSVLKDISQTYDIELNDLVTILNKYQ